MRCLTLVVVDLAVLVLVARVARARDDEDGSKPIRRSTSEIMQESARERPRELRHLEIRRNELDRSRLPVNPDSPRVSRLGGSVAAPETGRPARRVQAPQAVSTPNFTSVTTDSAAFVPPDTMGAVGPTSFLTAVNGRIRAHSKISGAVGALDSDDGVFWASVSETPANPFLSYPRVRFDRFTDKWFLTILDIPADVGTNGSRILIAMSDGPDITASTSWEYFFFDQDLASPAGDAGCLSNYPTLGIDVNALYIGANIYCGSSLPSLTFFNTSVWVVRKSALLNPSTTANLTLTPGAVTAFRDLLPSDVGPGLFAPQGVDNDDPGATRGRFIGVDNASFGTLVLRDVNNPGSGTPTLSANTFLTVPATTFPIDVTTPGGGRPLDGLDDRLLAAHVRAGRIWTAQQIQVNSGGVASATGNRNGVRWYQIDVSALPTLIQVGTVFDPSVANPLSYWMGTVMVSGQGHAALGFTAGSPVMRPAAATVGRLAGDAPGTTQGLPVIYHAGEADYVDIVSGPPARWGNYSMTTLDPCDDMTMWTTQEFAATPGLFDFNWGARVVRLLAPPPATPLSAVPPTVAIGQPSVSVTVTGSTAGGAAFYDTPAAGMSACRTRIAGLVGNGVTVNSITFVNAQTVTLDLNTMVATPGSATITITNPDGQSAMGSVLTIPPATGAVVFGTKTVSGVLSSGGSITYTVTLTNSGLAQGDNPGDELSDILPSSLTLVSAAATSGTASADLGTNTVGWNGTIPASGSVTISIQATVNAATPAGTIVSNQGTINYDADGNGTNEANVFTDDPGEPGPADPTVFVLGASYYALTPCRGADTRGADGTSGGPALGANTTRTFPVTGLCGVPTSAAAVALNVTVVGETDFGDLRLYPAGGAVPSSSTINFAVSKVRANNAIIPLGSGGQITVQCDMPPGSAGQTHFLFDVYGYFQ
jgi:uncharacterized repeat protein (TIGR01451 family)